MAFQQVGYTANVSSANDLLKSAFNQGQKAFDNAQAAASSARDNYQNQADQLKQKALGILSGEMAQAQTMDERGSILSKYSAQDENGNSLMSMFKPSEIRGANDLFREGQISRTSEQTYNHNKKMNPLIEDNAKHRLDYTEATQPGAINSALNNYKKENDEHAKRLASGAVAAALPTVQAAYYQTGEISDKALMDILVGTVNDHGSGYSKEVRDQLIGNLPQLAKEMRANLESGYETAVTKAAETEGYPTTQFGKLTQKQQEDLDIMNLKNDKRGAATYIADMLGMESNDPNRAELISKILHYSSTRNISPSQLAFMADQGFLGDKGNIDWLDEGNFDAMANNALKRYETYKDTYASIKASEQAQNKQSKLIGGYLKSLEVLQNQLNPDGTGNKETLAEIKKVQAKLDESKQLYNQASDKLRSSIDIVDMQSPLDSSKNKPGTESLALSQEQIAFTSTVALNAKKDGVDALPDPLNFANRVNTPQRLMQRIQEDERNKKTNHLSVKQTPRKDGSIKLEGGRTSQWKKPSDVSISDQEKFLRMLADPKNEKLQYTYMVKLNQLKNTGDPEDAKIYKMDAVERLPYMMMHLTK